VNENGLLGIPWPAAISGAPDDVDVILATVTKPDPIRPSPEKIAEAWVDQNHGYERYFFENVRHGIRTPEDARIWSRIQNRNPAWLSQASYAKPIEILRAETKRGV
jgi:hypothetical protein